MIVKDKKSLAALAACGLVAAALAGASGAIAGGRSTGDGTSLKRSRPALGETAGRRSTGDETSLERGKQQTIARAYVGAQS